MGYKNILRKKIKKEKSCSVVWLQILVAQRTMADGFILPIAVLSLKKVNLEIGLIWNFNFNRRASFQLARNSVAVEKRGRAKIPSPQPPSFLPARAFGLAREARHQFRSKKVRAELYNSTT